MMFDARRCLPGAAALVLAALVAGLSGTAVAASEAGRTWFAVALITATFGWLAAQVWQTSRARIPAFEASAR
jgi:hypothetical protein